eukprot:CAMPEP_0175163902 /NCGR_PEP_ID=MMETSP0087-20121206/26057_1 /TAXON_ID=136419 /ORGANISM="Unknown Unknown, Strain D1" /LENGTH=254 /DNA_ID=CAMNT_0016452757 /DNA_START=234 /DNA_END=995 /DNA_ORIENTATION=-
MPRPASASSVVSSSSTTSSLPAAPPTHPTAIQSPTKLAEKFVFTPKVQPWVPSSPSPTKKRDPLFNQFTNFNAKKVSSSSRPSKKSQPLSYSLASKAEEKLPAELALGETTEEHEPATGTSAERWASAAEPAFELKLQPSQYPVASEEPDNANASSEPVGAKPDIIHMTHNVEVLIEKAAGLIDESGVFVMIKIGKFWKRSKVVKGNKNPVWNESIFFDGVSAKDEVLVEMHNNDNSQSQNDLIGKQSFSVREL